MFADAVLGNLKLKETEKKIEDKRNKDHDIWFGELLKKFKSSTLYDNTILVVTTDHATHPSPEFKQTFSSDVPYFVDKVPFIIHYKGVNPMQIDAKMVGNQNNFHFVKYLFRTHLCKLLYSNRSRDVIC